ncbi:hypothetical protein L4C36_11025 [Photobacterium japonica]|uniref:hypothetical protein n=1 Tax=Photobacterium japonica TaxID=2910235 RepID=UPI003D0F1EE7
MKITKRQAKTVYHAIDDWEKQQLLSHDNAQSLRDSVVVVGFDWKLLAVYSFWIAITCCVISVGVLLADDYLMQLLAKLIDTPASVLAVISAGIAALAYYFGAKRRLKHPEKRFSNEAVYFFGVLMSAVSIGFLRETAWFDGFHLSFFLGLLMLVYGAVGLRLNSLLIWLFALLSLAGWGIELTDFWADPNGYFLGLNMAWRLAIIGALVLGATTRHALPLYLKDATRFMGWLYLLSALWLISIIGNYTSAAAWANVSQFNFIHWAVLSGVICLGAIGYGIRQDDTVARSFGMIFLLLNLYTRFFEYFWDSLHKTVFFALLALSFWFIGSRAEQLWQLTQQQANKAATEKNTTNKSTTEKDND